MPLDKIIVVIRIRSYCVTLRQQFQNT